ncbi:MAG TPA: glycosyltransferase [Sedimentisphaerales bacterium]|nr:glycosyltransferase [Sedimentisphaerales bacterium]
MRKTSMEGVDCERQRQSSQASAVRPGLADSGSPESQRSSGVTILVPAYNERDHIAETIRSLLDQALPPAEIIVIDDCSSDGTADVATEMGVTVVRPPANTGSKAGAQNYGLQFVRTEYTMAVDADTTLAPDAIEKIMDAFEDESIVAACGLVLPRKVRTVWERGRYVEYLFAFTFYKPIQDFYDKPLISSGCFSAYRTDALRSNGGWSTRTMAEDMDLTWSFYHKNQRVRFVPEAVCYPLEPHNYNFMSKQLRRWSHGFVQNVRLHWRELLGQPYLRTMVAVAMWDAVTASLLYLVVLPILAAVIHPMLLLGYLIDAPAVAVPVVLKGLQRREVGKVLTSLPSFFVLRIVNGVFMLNAVWSEMVMGRRLQIYEKGH